MRVLRKLQRTHVLERVSIEAVARVRRERFLLQEILARASMRHTYEAACTHARSHHEEAVGEEIEQFFVSNTRLYSCRTVVQAVERSIRTAVKTTQTEMHPPLWNYGVVSRDMYMYMYMYMYL